MDSGERMVSSDKRRDGQSAIGRTGLMAGAALLGAAVAVLVMRMMQGTMETVSTASLLTFFLMAGLAVAAIVLAVTAILLSRTAERVVTEKAAEISALQAAVIMKASTGTGRIELCVSRAGEEAAETLSRPQIQVMEVPEHEPSGDSVPEIPTVPVAEEIPEQVRAEEAEAEPVPEPVLEPTGGSEPAAEQLPEKPLDDSEAYLRAEKKYGAFKDIVLLGAANYPGVVARKVGEGEYRTEGDDLVDGAFVMNSEKVAVCTFATSQVITDRFTGKQGDSFNRFLDSLKNELDRGHFTRVFFVFDGKLSPSGPYAEALNGLSLRIDPETFARFELFEGTPDVVIPVLTERISQLMEAPEEKEAAEPEELSFRRRTGS